MHRTRSTRPFVAGVIATFTTLVLISASAAAAPFFADGLESADFNNNSNGFRWASPNRTSIVRDDGYVVNNGDPINIGPLPELQWENGPASSGRHSMRFRYAAGAAMTEQRFSLGGAYPDLWMSFWLRVPINFTHPSSSPNNQKLLAIWSDGYEAGGDGSTVWLSFFHSGGGSSKFGATYTEGRRTGSKAYEQNADFISTPGDRGRWMQLVLNVKAETSPGAGNGHFKVWRRWKGQSSFSQTQSLTGRNIRLPSGGPNGFAAGYLMGWANAPYPVNTEFLMDDFKVSTTSLLDGSEASPPENSPPKPPTDVRAN